MKQIVAGLALAFAFVGGVGCGGSQKTKTAAAPTCADVGAHARVLYMATPDSAAEAGDLVQKTITESCTTDAWSAEVIGCMAKATEQEMGGCADKLTQAQRDSFGQAMNAAAGGGEAPPANEFDNAGGE